MSILIKGMEMPTVRDTLVLVKTNGTAIVYEDEAYVTTAITVPPHGDLIERDTLISVIGIMSDKCDNPVVWEQMRYIAEDMTTIIPAEEGE